MGTTTPNLGLYKPAVAETGWGSLVDGNFDALDTAIHAIGINIESKGASTGAADNAAAIQAALDEAGATVGPVAGGLVFIPKGQYTILSQIQVPNFVRLVGLGSRTSRIIAGASFPTSTPVVRLGKVGDAVVFGTSVEYLRIDANSIPGSTCLYSTAANEKSGAFFCNLSNFRATGIDYTGTSFAHVHDCEMAGSASGSTTGIWSHATSGPTIISGEITINNSAPNTDGLLVTSTFAIDGIFHVEHATNAVTVTGGSGGYINFILGHSSGGVNSVTNLLNIGPSFTGCLRAYNLVHGVSGVLVNDQPKGTTVVGSQITEWKMNGATRSQF